MSFQLPQNIPASLRPGDDNNNDNNRYWRASSSTTTRSGTLGGYGLHSQQPGSGGGGGGSSLANKLNHLFDGDRHLPMYKDKPYFAPRRTGGWMPAAAGAAGRRRRRKLVYGLLGLALLGFVWWCLGEWGSASADRLAVNGSGGLLKKGGDLWSWVQSFEKPEKDATAGKKGKGKGKGKKKGGGGEGEIDWAARREKVRDAFMVSWDGYEKYAWGFDEYYPISKSGKNMIEGGMGWIIVDALDTMMIMNLTSRVQHARNWIHTSLRYNQDHDVSTFETTIRMLGGLLSAHYLSTKYPDLAPISDDDAGAPGEDLYIEKATDLADRLMGAFESKSGIPYASVNLNTSTGIPSHMDGGASSTAEATSVQLEFKYLAKLTGEAEYWRRVEKVMQVVDDQEMEDGLLPIYIHPDTGKFRGQNIRLGSRGDSYYEYLIKQYLQTSKQEPIYKELWDEALMGIRKHLVTYTKHAQLTIVGERPDGLHGALSPKMDHLVCFLPGAIALGATGGIPLSEAKKSPDWTVRHDEEILLAKELMKTCWATYLATKTGLAPEITYFEIDDRPRMMTDMFPDSTMTRGNEKSSPAKNKNDPNRNKDGDLHLVSQPLYPLEDQTLAWRRDIDIHAQDQHNLQRPETVESLFYMYRITGDETYRHWGWEMFKSFVKYTAVVEEEDESETSSKEGGKDTTSNSEKSSSSSNTNTNTKDGKDKKPNSYIRAFTSLSNANTLPPVPRDNMESFWLAETLKYFYLLFSPRDFIPLEETVFNTEAHPLPRFTLSGELRTGWERKPRKKQSKDT